MLQLLINVNCEYSSSVLLLPPLQVNKYTPSLDEDYKLTIQR